MRKRVVRGPDGVDKNAVEISYRVTGEHWNEYLVDDGTVIRLKPVVTQVLRIEGEFDQNGDPLYFLQSTNIMSISAPDELRKGEGQ